MEAIPLCGLICSCCYHWDNVGTCKLPLGGLHSSFNRRGSVPKSNPLTIEHICLLCSLSFFFFWKGSSSILLRLKNDWRLNRFCSLLSWVPGVFSRDASRTAAGRHVKTLRLASLNVKAKGAILLIFLSVDSAAMHDDTALVTRSEVFLDPHTKELVRGESFKHFTICT